MVKIIEMNAVKREKAGKGASRAVRRTGFIPAVIYGDKKDPVMISVEEKVLTGMLKKAGFWTHQIEISVDGEKTRTLCQDIQFHRLTDRPIHADFLRISKNAHLVMEIPVHFENEENAPGIKNGGVLNIVHRALEVACSSDNIPDRLVLDLGSLQIGEGLTNKDIVLPAGVKFPHDEEFTIVTISEPAKEEVVEEAAPAAAAEAAAPAEKAAEEKKEG